MDGINKITINKTAATIKTNRYFKNGATFMKIAVFLDGGGYEFSGRSVVEVTKEIQAIAKKSPEAMFLILETNYD